MNFVKLTEIATAMRDDEVGGKINHHVSFVLYKNRILSIGKNNHKTHPINLLNPKFNRELVNISSEKKTCSELAAIIKLKNTSNVAFNRCSLINIRVDRTGVLNNSCPCSSCKSLIKYFGFKNVFYSNELGEFVEYIY